MGINLHKSDKLLKRKLNRFSEYEEYYKHTNIS